MSFKQNLVKKFGVEDKGSTLRQEIIAGVTTFLTMAYIVLVNPSILMNAIGLDGKPIGETAVPTLTLATALGAAIATAIMALYANKPFALAPGMGLNAYFTFVVTHQYGIPFQTALGIVFIEGIIFLILTVTKARGAIVNAIPVALKNAIAAGIGLFLTLIGLKLAGIVVGNPETLVTLGNILSPTTILAIIGFFLAAILLVLRVPGSLLISIIVVFIISIVAGLQSPPEKIVAMPSWDINYTLFKADWSYLISITGVVAVFTMFMVDFFDTMGTVTGLSALAGYLKPDGTVEDIDKMLLSDAIGTIEGAILGTSTITTYIESAAGVEEGGRTGITALVVAGLFLLTVFFWPIVTAIPSYATAPALILVGLLMMSALANIDFRDYSEAIPAFVTIVLMPMTYSISNGIGGGIIAYVVIKTLTGKYKEVHPIMYVLAIMFAIYFVAISGGI
ncbi:MAG TPA: NCS2 family permease [Euryarchaeota archaeon]|nr:NCS2 family permease [Euryarchaeota archaeon]